MDVIQDIHYAARLTRKSPGFSLCVVALLGLGIGLNSAIFTLLDALLLRPLPVKNPAELVRLVQVSPNLGPRSYFTYGAYRALDRDASSFTSLFGYQDLNVPVADGPTRSQGLTPIPGVAQARATSAPRQYFQPSRFQ